MDNGAVPEGEPGEAVTAKVISIYRGPSPDRESFSRAQPTTITIRVQGTPIPAPRQTRYSKHDPRRVGRYHEWARTVRLAYRQAQGPMFEGPVALAFTFRRRHRGCDLDNLVKAAIDALHGLAWSNDNVKHIPRYDSVCCLKVSTPAEEGLELTIRPLGGK